MRRLFQLLLNLVGAALAGICVAFALLGGAALTALTFTPNPVGLLVVALVATTLLFAVQAKADRRRQFPTIA